MNFTRKKGGDYYRQTTFEFNLPTGWTCPFADDCLTKVDRETGKRVMSGHGYVCYAASAERYPSARASRWKNFEDVKAILKTDELFEIPKRATHVRIHGAGDFFSQKYFDRWVATAKAYPDVKFWAFTKSIQYWVNRLDQIPDNLEMQASRGSKQDHLIDEYNLKCAEVFKNIEDIPEWMMIDFDDWAAQQPGPSFALLENLSNRNQSEDPRVAAHNERAQELQAAGQFA